jgi:hypothetical protein
MRWNRMLTKHSKNKLNVHKTKVCHLKFKSLELLKKTFRSTREQNVINVVHLLFLGLGISVLFVKIMSCVNTVKQKIVI